MTITPDFNPALFSADAVDEETRAFARKIKDAELNAPAREDLDFAHERGLTPGAGILPASIPAELAEERSIFGPAGALTIRVIPPRKKEVTGLYVHLHGGGFCLGSAHGQDPMLEALADNAGVVAISVDYRLAPEHPFPAGLADVEAALWWAVRQGSAEFGTDRIVAGGESAGANLTVGAAIRLRDRRGYTGLAGLNLSQGGYDLRMTPSMRAGKRTSIVNTPTLANHLHRYLQGRNAENPEISPLLADLHGLPPALFTVGTADPTLDDSLFMYMRWISSGNAAALAIYPGGVHGFTFTPTDMGRKASRHIEQFVAERCRDTGG